jgi:hypothetical protein
MTKLECKHQFIKLLHMKASSLVGVATKTLIVLAKNVNPTQE